MTGLQMQIMFQDIIEESTKGISPKWVPVSEIIFEYLTEVQNNFFLQRYVKPSFVETVNTMNVLVDELQNLITASNPTTLSTSNINANIFDVEFDSTGYFLKGFVKNGTYFDIPIKAFEGDASRFIPNATNLPILLEPIIVKESNYSYKVFIDTFAEITIAANTDVYIYVVAFPTPITIDDDCLLHESFHSMLVREAATRLLSDKFGIRLEANKKPQEDKK